MWVRLVAEGGLPLVAMRGKSILLLLLRLRVFLLAQDLQLQEKLLLLKEAGVRRVHGRRGLLCLLIGRNVLVVLELLHLWLHIFGFFVSVLV